MVCLLPTLIRLSASVDIAYTRIIDLNNALYACMVASDQKLIVCLEPGDNLDFP